MCTTTGWILHVFDISVVQFTLTHDGDYYHSRSLWKFCDEILPTYLQ